MNDKNNIELVDFTDLTQEEKLIVLEWRNSKKVRRWMHRKDMISTEEHLRFIELLRDDKTKKYFLVRKETSMIGVIYFTNIDTTMSCTEFGIYSDPLLKGNGVLLMQEIKQYAFDVLMIKTLSAEVFTENIKAITLYLKNGFRQVQSYNLDSQKILLMELKNENR